MYYKLLAINPIATNNYVAFTFFVGTMAMLAASVFFFFEVSNTDKKWRTSVLISGLITFIAAVHYYYMRDYQLLTGLNRSVENQKYKGVTQRFPIEFLLPVQKKTI